MASRSTHQSVRSTTKLKPGKSNVAKISHFRRSKKKYAMFPGTEDVQLDRFQRTLLEMITNASDIALGRFFKKNHRPLYQFLLRLYLLSLTNQHPDRGRINKKNKIRDQETCTYTTKETKIISEWANVLTEDYDDDEFEEPNATNVFPDTHTANVPIETSESDHINSIERSKTSGADRIDAQIETQQNEDTIDANTTMNMDHPVSFQGFAMLSTAIESMRHRRGFNSFEFPKPINEDEQLEATETKETQQGIEYSPIRRSTVIARRESMWDGILDVNNVIMTPETPKWHSQSSYYQLQVSEDGLLDCIVSTLSPANLDHSLTPTLIEEVSKCNGDILCLFVPFLCIISSKFNDDKYRNELQTALLKRVGSDVDINQQFQLFLNSYKDSPNLIKSLKKIKVNLMKQRRTHKDDQSANVQLSLLSPRIRKYRMNQLDSNSSDCAQVICQEEAESAISVFLSIFRYNLSSGSELKLCSASSVRDPINCNAPPLSRIEVRKIMATKSRPFLCDLYVSARNANYFEYLSSTVLIKKGDDLRRDVAVMHVFRLMNKIWRERGLSFGGCPVRALTYKCCAISPSCGVIELIDGCKPLRLVSALEDTITIAQQFNLVSSAVASYIGAFVMGVRDRHFDNVLIRNSDCTLFHIDFGFVLGETASVDTSKFAITNDLKKLMGIFWDQFIELGVQSYLALRDKHKELITYAQIAFGAINKAHVVEGFIKNQLHIHDMSHHQAAKYIARKLKESPNSTRTKFKNAVHKIATIMD